MRWRASLALAAAPVVIAASSPDQTGRASWYGDELRGSRTASGERFDPDALTAAHRSLPLGSWAEVTALDTGRTVRVRINDRGPFHGDRIIDLSAAAARRLGISGNGARLVRIHAVSGDAPVSQTDAQTLGSLRRATAWSPPALQAAAGEPPYFIQIASFSSPSRARALATGIGADIARSNGLYRVRIGPLQSARALNAALAKLAAKGYSDIRIAH